METHPTPGTGPSPPRSDTPSDDPNPEPPATPTLEEVFHAYGPRVFSVARRMVANETDAEDVTQEVLLRLVEKLPSFRGESAFPTWLHRITINTALTHRRKRAVRDENRIDDPLEALLESGGDEAYQRTTAPEAVLEEGETRRLIERAVAGLPELYRQVFVLSDIEGLPNADIADRVGTSLPAVKSRLHRARALLREALAPHFDETLA